MRGFTMGLPASEEGCQRSPSADAHSPSMDDEDAEKERTDCEESSPQESTSSHPHSIIKIPTENSLESGYYPGPPVMKNAWSNPSYSSDADSSSISDSPETITESNDIKENKEIKEIKETKKIKEKKETKEIKGTKGPKGAKDNSETKELKEIKIRKKQSLDSPRSLQARITRFRRARSMTETRVSEKFESNSFERSSSPMTLHTRPTVKRKQTRSETSKPPARLSTSKDISNVINVEVPPVEGIFQGMSRKEAEQMLADIEVSFKSIEQDLKLHETTRDNMADPSAKKYATPKVYIPDELRRKKNKVQYLNKMINALKYQRDMLQLKKSRAQLIIDRCHINERRRAYGRIQMLRSLEKTEARLKQIASDPPKTKPKDPRTAMKLAIAEELTEIMEKQAQVNNQYSNLRQSFIKYHEALRRLELGLPETDQPSVVFPPELTSLKERTTYLKYKLAYFHNELKGVKRLKSLLERDIRERSHSRFGVVLPTVMPNVHNLTFQHKGLSYQMTR